MLYNNINGLIDFPHSQYLYPSTLSHHDNNIYVSYARTPLINYQIFSFPPRRSGTHDNPWKASSNSLTRLAKAGYQNYPFPSSESTNYVMSYFSPTCTLWVIVFFTCYIVLCTQPCTPKKLHYWQTSVYKEEEEEEIDYLHIFLCL